jgi:tryptophan synthase beta chain
MRDKILGKKSLDIIAVEPKSCPSFTRGKFAYDFCDTGNLTPLAKMYTLGSGFVPSADHAGGLRYHGMSPVLSQLYHDGHMSAEAYKQTEVFEAASLFARVEQILPAPESAHAIKGTIEYAKNCQRAGEAKTILFGLTGTGYFDLAAYQSYQDGTMIDYEPSDAELAKSLKNLPKV